jgi:hypothetical protein
LDIEVNNKEVLNQFLNKVENKILWSDIYLKLEYEFYKNDFVTSDNIDVITEITAKINW